MRTRPVRRITGDTFFAWDGELLAPLFGVRVVDIEVVFGRESVNKPLRIRAPRRLPAALAEAGAGAAVEL